MGTAHSPSANTSGLVFCLDPANTRSYSGVGGSVNDIAGSRSTTLINGISHSYSKNGLFTFNGSNQYIDLGSDVVFKTSGGWTVETWAYFSAVNAGNLYNFIGADSIVYNSWYWTVYNSKLAIWNLSPGGWYYGSTTIQPGTWYHCVLVCQDNGTTYKMYLNGVPEGGTHATYSFNASNSGLSVRYIGRGNAANGRYHHGSYGLCKFYNRALSDSEVLNNYNVTKNRYVTTPTLVTNQLRLNLDANNSASYGGSGTSWSDLSGGSFNGTLTNGPTYSSSNGGFLTFDGVDDYLSLPHSSLLNLGQDLTICGFIKLTNTTQNTAYLFSSLDVANGSQTKGIGFYWMKTAEYGLAANQLRLQLGRTAWAWQIYGSDANSIADTNWHFIALTVKNINSASRNVTFYVDGNRKTTSYWTPNAAVDSANYSTDSSAVRVASAYSPGLTTYYNSYSAMSIGELKIFTRHLNEKEIGRLFDIGRGRFGL
jgi:hypothetical protein